MGSKDWNWGVGIEVRGDGVGIGALGLEWGGWEFGVGGL